MIIYSFFNKVIVVVVVFRNRFHEDRIFLINLSDVL